MLFVCTLNAQTADEIAFKRLGERYGLSCNRVRNIFEDKDGFVWVATEDGLNRFDGYEYKVYRPLSDQGISLGYVSINDIYQTEKGQLWIGTDYGAYKFTDNKVISYRSLPQGSYRQFLKKDASSVWILHSNGLAVYDFESKDFCYFVDNKSHPLYGLEIFKIFEDRRGNFWFTSTALVIKYDPRLDTYEKYHQFKGLDLSTRNDILAIEEDKQGKIWLGFGQNGLFNYDPATGDKVFKKHSDGIVMDVHVDEDNILWVAKGSNQGLYMLNLETQEEATFLYDVKNPNSLNDSSVVKIFEDSFGDIWVGTFGSGINYFSKRKKKIYGLKQGKGDVSFESNLINYFHEDGQHIWIGTEGGVDRWDRLKKQFTHYSYEENDKQSLRRDPIRVIESDTSGNIWIGAWDGGLSKFNRATNNFKRYAASNEDGALKSDNVVSSKKDSKGRFWVGTFGGGLHLYDAVEDNFKAISLTQKENNSLASMVSDIQETKDGLIVYNSYRTLNFYNPDKDQLQSYDLAKQVEVSEVNIICLFVDNMNKIWLGTNIGLYHFDQNEGKFTSYPINADSDQITVMSIIADDEGDIWFGSNNGLYKIQKKDNKVVRFSSKDGFNTNSFIRKSAYKTKDGMLLFGTSKGMNFFYPDELKINTKAPKLHISSLSVLKSHPNLNKEYEYILEDLGADKEITLSENQSSFVISFTGLNYLDPEKNEYKYKLEGYDEIWIDAGQKRTATYTNVPPGKYTFKVSGTNSDGIGSLENKEIKIIKKGPWYSSRWFKNLLLTSIILLPVLFYVVRISILKKQKSLLKHKVAERTKDLTVANDQLIEKSIQIEIQNEELSQHRYHLEEIVNERTKELSKAKVKAEESDRLKSAFIANMSHEIRTPMNAIHGFSGMLEDEDTSAEERKEYVQIIKDSCKALLVLIDDILDISIMDAKGINLNLERLDVRKFLGQLKSIYETKVSENVMLIVENDTPIFISTDEVRLRQILSNLLNNAVKFTEQGSVKFGSKLEGDSIIFYVKDTGIGIAEGDLDMIFKPFNKVSNRNDKIYRGTGIGLSITQRIVDSLKGEIWVESNQGEGSNFYVKLPYTNAS